MMFQVSRVTFPLGAVHARIDGRGSTAGAICELVALSFQEVATASVSFPRSCMRGAPGRFIRAPLNCERLQ
jgi:hypothetical protein